MLTCHLVIPDGHPGDEFFEQLYHQLHHQFGIDHLTIQIELGNAGARKLAPEHVV